MLMSLSRNVRGRMLSKEQRRRWSMAKSSFQATGHDLSGWSFYADCTTDGRPKEEVTSRCQKVVASCKSVAETQLMFQLTAHKYE